MESCCSETFWSLVITTLAGICILSVRMMYKSKCRKVNCCGVEFERDLEIELQEDIKEIENKIQHSSI